MNERYKTQVRLLLDVLPFVAEEENLALHGGTAINLFVREMPRLSVDIDLTYLPVEARPISLRNIAAILGRIEKRLHAAIRGVSTELKPAIGKLLITKGHVGIKIEVNLIKRGIYEEVQTVVLCDRAQETFDAFVEVTMVSPGQLYGGKISAALGRQHPRDLFDVKYLLDNEGFTDEIKKGFLFSLLGSERPVHELLAPHLLDQQSAFTSQFAGMTSEPFTYDDYEATRTTLVKTVQKRLKPEDKTFLTGFQDLQPEWQVYPFESFPAIQWKLQNLQKLKEQNPEKYEEQKRLLADVLG